MNPRRRLLFFNMSVVFGGFGLGCDPLAGKDGRATDAHCIGGRTCDEGRCAEIDTELSARDLACIAAQECAGDENPEGSCADGFASIDEDERACQDLCADELEAV